MFQRFFFCWASAVPSWENPLHHLGCADTAGMLRHWHRSPWDGATSSFCWVKTLGNLGERDTWSSSCHVVAPLWLNAWLWQSGILAFGRWGLRRFLSGRHIFMLRKELDTSKQGKGYLLGRKPHWITLTKGTLILGSLGLGNVQIGEHILLTSLPRVIENYSALLSVTASSFCLI